MCNIECNTDKVKDVVEAKDIVLDYLSEQGIVVFSYEINSIFKKSGIWFVIIEGKTFNGAVFVRSKTGEVVTEVQL
jgi:hypothetical protein